MFSVFDQLCVLVIVLSVDARFCIRTVYYRHEFNRYYEHKF